MFEIFAQGLKCKANLSRFSLKSERLYFVVMNWGLNPLTPSPAIPTLAVIECNQISYRTFVVRLLQIKHRRIPIGLFK